MAGPVVRILTTAALVGLLPAGAAIPVPPGSVAPIVAAPGCAVRLTQPLPVPAIEDGGRGVAMDAMVPAYGASYTKVPYLRRDVVAYRRWRWRTLHTSLDAKTRANPSYLNTYRLAADAYLVNGRYPEALGQLDEVLRRRPADPHALAVTALIRHVQGVSSDATCRLARLRAQAPAAAAAVAQLVRFTRQSMSQRYVAEPVLATAPEAIVVFGQPALDNGTPTSGLLQRLTTTKGLAERYPTAVVVVSGAAVRSAYPEAAAMRRWLVEQGIAPTRIVTDTRARDTVGNAIGMLRALRARGLHRVVAVTSLGHLPRAVTTLRVTAARWRWPLVVHGAGSGSPPATGSRAAERRYTYVTAARAAGLIEPIDVARYLQTTRVRRSR